MKLDGVVTLVSRWLLVYGCWLGSSWVRVASFYLLGLS